MEKAGGRRPRDGVLGQRRERRARSGGRRPRFARHKIGELTVERDFLGTRAHAMSRNVRKAMIEPGHAELSLSRQCRLVAISRSSLYYPPAACH